MLDKMARFLFAVILIGVSINYFYPLVEFIKYGSRGAYFVQAVEQTGYMMEMVKLIEVSVAILFLLNRYILLGLLLIAPIVVNIFMFHLMIEQSGLLMALVMVVLWGIIFYSRKDQFKFLIKP